MIRPLFLLLCTILFSNLAAQNTSAVHLVPVDSGWAKNSINAVIFRKNSLVTLRDTQYIAYYDPESFMVLGKRRLGATNWEINRTPYRGRTTDAHNSISLMVDGDGYIHLAWDHHNNPLRYARSTAPGSLELTEKMSMTGKLEERVTYPEFHFLPEGDLLFFYRDGESGRGNLVINRYDISTRRWTQLHHNLIDGEDQRNAYWQACIDRQGTVHISWVWRESADVSSNHDLAYARSTDGGETWERSTGEKYSLPITAATAEYACRIPQQSELINQTSMYADEKGRPFIASYWRAAGDSIPQYHLVYKQGENWAMQNLGFRQTPFTLSGGGTKRIPISRPQIVAWENDNHPLVAIIFRDAERDNKVSVAVNRRLPENEWQIQDLTREGLGSWEPTYDTELWKEQGLLHLFIQKVEQVDGEGIADMPPTLIQVLEWTPESTKSAN